MNAIHRRRFLRNLGISSAALPFLAGLPSLGLSSTSVLWGRAPGVAAAYATSGTGSLFAFDPDPEELEEGQLSLTALSECLTDD